MSKSMSIDFILIFFFFSISVIRLILNFIFIHLEYETFHRISYNFFKISEPMSLNLDQFCMLDAFIENRAHVNFFFKY